MCGNCFFDLCFGNNGKDFNSFSVVSKTAFQRIGSLLDIAKLINFIADFGII